MNKESSAQPAPGTVSVTVDFAKATGPVKPVNGIGQPPMVNALRDWRMLPYLREAGIPYSRLHDVGGWLGGGLYVDIPNVFPDFNADENDPASYRFAFTDSLLKALAANDVKPIYRLGVTIENWVASTGLWQGLPRIRTMPPSDFGKWARVCEHVVRHCNEGWADGMELGIEHWEIWNEPDTGEGSENPMWGGTWDEFIRLYGATAPLLKAAFPHIKVGGYGCGCMDAGHAVTAGIFLDAVRENGWPLDFFSFHSYSDPEQALKEVRFADEFLAEHGFPRVKCERVFDEWMPCGNHANTGTARQAGAIAAELLGLQNGPCDIACIYDGRCSAGDWSALFNPFTYGPHKAYYAFTAFNELRKRGTAVEVKVAGADGGVHAAAARGKDGSAALMIANDNDRWIPVSFEFGGLGSSAGTPKPRCRRTDGENTDFTCDFPGALSPHSFLLMEFE